MSEAATAHRTAGANAVASVIAALQDRLGDRLSLSQAVREQHGRGETWHATKAPDAVAFADSPASSRSLRIWSMASWYALPCLPRRSQGGGFSRNSAPASALAKNWFVAASRYFAALPVTTQTRCGARAGRGARAAAPT